MLAVVFGLGLVLVIPHRQSLVTTPTPIVILKAAPIPVLTAGKTLATRPPATQAATLQQKFTSTLSAQAVYVLDTQSATPLLSVQAEQLRLPASTTKLLTALVSLRVYEESKYLRVKEEAFTQGTTMGLELGEDISVRELLYGLLMQSGNDAAFMLANNHPQGYSGFVTQMNQVAAELHLKQTSFTNPSGLDHPAHLTSARDLALLSQAVMHEPLLASIVGTKKYTTAGPLGELRHELVNTNALLGEVPGVIGVKTGTTEQAGQVLITQVERAGNSVVIVVMGSLDRYGETRTIIDWIWQNYRWFEPESLDTLEAT